jgi:hypothetical protein
MATTAAPDGVVLNVVRGADGSPSQERLVRIAAMLREAELAVPVATRRPERGRRDQRVRRTARIRRAA